MNLVEPKSPIHLYPQHVFFSTTNLSFRNKAKWLRMPHPPSQESSWFNTYVMPSMQLVDTYSIYWTDALEETYRLGIPIGHQVCELRCTSSGRILTLYTEPPARQLGIASYILRHSVLQYNKVECYLPMMWIGYQQWLEQNGVEVIVSM